MKQLSFVEQVKLKSGKLVMAYYGVLPQDETPIFAYILCDEQQVRLLRQDHVNKTVRPLKDYGQVLYMDIIAAADEKAEAFLRKWCAENGGNLL